VEHKVQMQSTQLPSGVTLKGVIDLITDEDGNEIIRDLKTVEKKPYGDPAGNDPSKHNIDAHDSQQLSMYHLMRYADHKNKTGKGKLPKAGKLVHVIRTPKKHEKSVVIQETTRDIEDMKILMRRIRKAIESAKAGIFLPANNSGYGSPCRFCDFADGTCEYVRKRGVE
jgi:DNA-binding protein YbaB